MDFFILIGGKIMRKLKININKYNIIFWILGVVISIIMNSVGYNITTWQWWCAIISLFIGFFIFVNRFWERTK